ncbi:hypothetical protein, partial [Paracidovorax konjaci]|uniref:hypothetical protein n=1 Tax=Paracidovorax konjaci TaxID=32040 RepID=UPI001C3165A1
PVSYAQSLLNAQGVNLTSQIRQYQPNYAPMYVSAPGQGFTAANIGQLRGVLQRLQSGSGCPALTPDGRVLTEHALERMMNPPTGRAPMTPSEVDLVLNGATNIRKMSPHPQGNTLTIQNRNMPGAPQVVVDAATGLRVITVINPRLKK